MTSSARGWSWLPLPGLTSPVWSSRRFWLLSVLSLRHILVFVRCELESPLFPRLLRRACAYGLTVWPLLHSRWSRVHGQASAGLISLSSVSVRSWFYRVSWLARVYSPALPICPTSSILRRSSFGISASVFASSLRDGATLPGRVCLSPRSERRLFLHLPGVWLESSRWGHPVGSILSQISIGSKNLCAPSLVVGAKPSRWGHPFRVVWRFSAHSIGTKASSVHLSFVTSRWGHPADRVCFSHTRS